MAEKLMSPGVFTQENDLSYLPRGIGEIGAAIVGPTVRGPAMVPIKINSYMSYVNTFGETIESGSNVYQYLTSHAAKEYLKYGGSLTVVRVASGSFSPAEAVISTSLGDTSFKLYTIGDGDIYNNSGSIGDNNILVKGTKDNIRWEITGLNVNKGTFSLIIRRGDDGENRKVVLETWSNLTLDPNEPNYISRVIGDQKPTYVTNDGDPYIEMSGSYPNKSKYVRVADVLNTINYLDDNGDIRDDALIDNLPAEGSGSYAGAFYGGSNGIQNDEMMFYENIGVNSQGLTPTACAEYSDAIALLGNQDEYDINLLLTPGITKESHGTLINEAIAMCETRGDCFYIMDLVNYNSGIPGTIAAQTLNTSYAAAYWPWVQIADNSNNSYRWVPASVVMGGVIAFNDKVAYEWYAPAGLNRGGVESAVRAERKLTHSNRDALYDVSINPLASFPNEGIVCWGQKTLQKKDSALNRVNVRRLLIKAKKYIASLSRYLIFEQNTPQTRDKFLNIANPFFENIQQNQGLYAFKVVMDETNNTPDVIDRNIMKGEIYLQPSKTAEYIVVGFDVTSTGALFNN